MSSIPTLVRPDSLAQQGYDTIRRAIRDGKIPRGQLFSESSLAESLGVSRTPVREALLNLFRDGVVEIVPKRGYRLVELDEGAISEIRLLRAALEQVVVGRLCTTVTPAEIRELRAILRGRDSSQEDMYTIDEAFHIRMAEMAGLLQIRRELLSVRGKMYLIASGTQVARCATTRSSASTPNSSMRSNGTTARRPGASSRNMWSARSMRSRWRGFSRRSSRG